MSYNGQTGSALSIAIPQGTNATVVLSGSPSQATDGASLAYAWSSGGYSIGTGVSSSIDVSSNASVALQVSQQDGQSASATGSIEVTNPVCPGITPIMGGCEDSGTSEQIPISGPGETQEPGQPHGGDATSKWVCNTTWWYEWNGSSWALVDVDILDCWLEPA